MRRRSLCYLAMLAALAMLPPSVLPSNASYQSEQDQSLVNEARETHYRERANALGEHVREVERNHDEVQQKLLKADLAYHHRLRAASDSFHRSKSTGKDESDSFQRFVNMTEAFEIEHALRTLQINADFDHKSLNSNQILDEKLSEADRRLTNVVRKVEE